MKQLNLVVALQSKQHQCRFLARNSPLKEFLDDFCTIGNKLKNKMNLSALNSILNPTDETLQVGINELNQYLIDIRNMVSDKGITQQRQSEELNQIASTKK